MIQMRALSSAARHSTWYISGSCRVLLDFLHGTELAAAESYCTLYTVEKWELSISA